MKYPFPMILMIAVRHLRDLVLSVYDALHSAWLLWLWGVKHGCRVIFKGKTIMLTHHRGDIVMGSCLVFNARGDQNLVGLINPTILACIGNGHITIGDHCGFSSVVMSSRISIEIGNHVTVGGNVRIFDHDFHELDPIARRGGTDGSGIGSSKVSIGDDVFIGTNTIILKGTRIGNRSIVAAGSVVFGLDIPPDSMVKGNPAIITSRKVGKFEIK